MSKIDEQYLSNSVYFIATGKTLEIIEKFEEDLLAPITSGYGAKKYSPAEEGEYAGKTHVVPAMFTFEQEITHPAFKRSKWTVPSTESGYLYEIDKETPEGRALQDRLNILLHSERDYAAFAERLTGKKYVCTNPDRLLPPGEYGWSGHYKPGNQEIAATYQKLGNVYIVKVPRVIHGIDKKFNEASLKDYRAEEFTVAGGEYDWLTPLGCMPLAYSSVVQLQEREQGDQMARRRINVPLKVSRF